ncbi:MAG: VOC family protein [Alphaproteobacteria bacterium]|nr:VOC family protein [Alphaproteobacteria bacterium]
MSVPFSMLGLDHVVIRTKDIARLQEFYTKVLGCTVDKVQDKLGLYQLRAGSALIDLVDVDGPLGKPGGAAPGDDALNMDHFCLRIEPFDADAIRKHLADHGVEITDEGERYGAEGMGPSIYVEDPDGNAVELKGPPKS